MRIFAKSPDTEISFRLSTTLLDRLGRASEKLDMSRSAICRRACNEFLSLYVPELDDPSVSVIEPPRNR